MNSERFRLRFIFWLDMNKPDQQALAEEIETLKEKRSFAKTVRDGIRLVMSLRQRRTDVLFELFPFLKTELSHAEPKFDTHNGQVQQQLHRIENLLLNTTADKTAPQPGLRPVGQGGIKQLDVPNIAAPVFDDDDSDLLIVQKAQSSGNANRNFVNSMFALQG